MLPGTGSLSRGLMAVNPTSVARKPDAGDLEFLFPAVIHLQRKNVSSAPAISEGTQVKKIEPVVLQDHSIKRGGTRNRVPLYFSIALRIASTREQA